MFKTLGTIIKDNWRWRKQIGHLSIFELIKQTRGTALGWPWLFVQPLVFIVVFWFALDIGLKASKDMPDPYFLWLVAGVIPWFFMKGMLGTGANVLTSHSYLVTKIKFPISGIPTFYCLSELIIHAGLLVVLFIIYFAFGMPLDLYLLQLPLIVFFMALFWGCYSMLTSLLSALSKDFYRLVRALVTPLFWISGIIFNVKALPIDWLQIVLMFNPVTFFATAYRDAFYYKVWIWEDPLSLIIFAAVFLVIFLLTLFVYKRLHKEVPDEL